MDVLSIENILLPLSTSYIGDDDLTFTSRRHVSEEGVALFKENYLLSAVDARINNYSSLFLTKKMLGEDVFTLNKRPSKVQSTLSVSLFIPNTDNAVYLPEGTNTRIDPVFSASKSVNTVFEIDFIGENTLRIAHQRGLLRYYLCVVDDAFFFTTSTNNYPNTIFYYILNDTQLYLFKIKNTLKQVVRCVDKLLELTDFSNFTENYFTVKKFSQNIDPVLSTSWVSYNSVRKNVHIINPVKSLSNLQSNYLISNQYSYLTGSDIPSNFITLKNQHTNNNYNSRQNIIEKNNANIPSIDRREYTCLVTGCEQEKGDHSITIPYEFYTADFKFVADKYTIFKLPESLYPYESINVNDSAINLVGAIGSDTPYTADRIFFRDTDKFISDGQYLCTWLSATNENYPGVWVDRYYYPEQSTYIAALTSKNTNIQVDMVDSLLLEKLPPSAYYDVTYFYTSSSQELLHTPQTTKDALTNIFFFDKKSDLTFLPGNEYIYFRVGDRYVESIVNTLTSNLIQNGLELKTSKNATVVNSSDEYVFDNNKYSLVESFRSINDTSQATISFWIDTPDWSKPLGHQILGNLNDRGISIINDPIITPLIQVQDGLKVFNLNSNFELINTSQLSPVDFSAIKKTTTAIDYLYTTTTYFVTAYYIKDLVRTDHLDVYQPIVVSYALSSYDLKAILTEEENDDKITTNDTCPLLLIDNPTTATEELLLADNAKLKVGKIPLTGIIVEPCNL